MVHDLTCSEVQDRAPSFALDILEPQARADVAAHLLRCTGCAREVSGMQQSAAELLSLDAAGDGPHADYWQEPGAAAWDRGDIGEPHWEWQDPEDPDWDWYGPDGDGAPPRRSRVRVVAAVTAAALLVIGTALGPELTQIGRTQAVPTASATLQSGQNAVGSALFYGGAAPVLVVDLTLSGVSGPLYCEVVSTSGETVQLGSFKLFAGSARWAVRDNVAPASTSEVLIVDQRGRSLATASVGG